MAAHRQLDRSRGANVTSPPPVFSGSVDISDLLDADLVMSDEPPASLARLKQMSDGFHYTMDYTEDWGVGHAEVCSLGEGLYVAITEADMRIPRLMHVVGPDVLRIRIASDGGGRYAPPHGDPISFDGPGAAIIIEPAGQPPADTVFYGRNRHVHVCADRGALQRFYGQNAHKLPEVLQAFLSGTLQQTVVRKLPLTSQLLRCLEDLLACTQGGKTRRLYIHSKSVEIFCLALEALENDQGFGHTEATSLTLRGVLKAQQILMKRYVSPPSLDELATAAGLSRQSLTAGFRKLLNKSVFDYIHDLRMKHALALLSARDASITEVAYALGYKNPSSFTVAVQRQFGVTPTELRNRG
jgi:AraC family transcriptional activator of pyochelin receptor